MGELAELRSLAGVDFFLEVFWFCCFSLGSPLLGKFMPIFFGRDFSKVGPAGPPRIPAWKFWAVPVNLVSEH